MLTIACDLRVAFQVWRCVREIRRAHPGKVVSINIKIEDNT